MRGSQPRWVPFQTSHPNRVFAFEKMQKEKGQCLTLRLGLVIQSFQASGGRALPDHTNGMSGTGEFQSLRHLGMYDIKCNGKTIGLSMRMNISVLDQVPLFHGFGKVP